MTSSPLEYDDDLIRSVLNRVQSIAVVGASANPDRASFSVSRFMIDKGYQVLPVNPGLAGKAVVGQPCYASLSDTPAPFQMVDIFRNSEAAASVVDEAVELASEKGISVIWMQLGVRHDAAAARAKAAGMTVIMDRCPKIEIGRLF